MFNPDKVIDGLSKQIEKLLKEFAKTKNLEERLKLSEIINNLVQSHGVYLDVMTNFMELMEEMGDAPFDDDEFEDDEAD